MHMRTTARLAFAALMIGLGMSTPLTALVEPGVAYAAPSESMPVYRAQIRFVTSSVGSAGTDDDVQVSLNDGNHTWVDYGRDDFEGGDDFTYDLSLTNLRTLSDIRYLTVQKTGTNGWCVESLSLRINGKAIYSRSFQTSTSACRWVDANDGHTPSFTIAGTTLRSHTLWQGYTAAARPTSMSRAELESRIEAIVGNWIEGVDDTYKWGNLNGSRFVDATPKDGRTSHVDLDLTRIYNNWPNTEADGDFDIQFACSGGRISVVVGRVGIMYTPWGSSLSSPPEDEPALQSALQSGLSAPLNALNSVLGLNVTATCPDVLVDGGGNVMIPQISSSNVWYDDPPILP